MDSSTPRTIKMGAERAIIYGMIMDVVRRCDAAYGKYQRRGSSIGATLETYMIVAAVLIGEMEGRPFVHRAKTGAVSWLCARHRAAEAR
jgi:hypothetical protein